MRFIRAVLKGIDSISIWSGKGVAWLVVAAMLLTLFDVFRRYIMGRAIMSAYELGYMLGGTFFLVGSAYVLQQRGHVRIDIIYNRLPPRARLVLDLVLTAGLFFPVMGLLFYFAIAFAQASWGWREVTPETRLLPMYPFKTVVPVAFGLLLLQGVAEFIRDLVALKTGERP